MGRRPACATVLAAAALAGCGDSDEPERRPPPARPSAEATVLAFFAAVEQRRPLEACGLMTRRARTALVDLAGARLEAKSCEGVVLQAAPYASGTKVTDAVEGRATATVKTTTQVAPVTFRLVKQPVGWRIDAFSRG